ncbi:hypothetical protein NP493_958g01002, partial [Ridgeia piscesae]
HNNLSNENVCLSAVTCKDGEIEHNGKCYKLYTERKNYADARATCRGAPGGGDLVTVDTAEMQDFVKAQLGSGAHLKYQGCFSDNNNARLVNSGSSKPENTPDSCIAECRNNNHQYAGVKRSVMFDRTEITSFVVVETNTLRMNGNKPFAKIGVPRITARDAGNQVYCESIELIMLE